MVVGAIRLCDIVLAGTDGEPTPFSCSMEQGISKVLVNDDENINKKDCLQRLPVSSHSLAVSKFDSPYRRRTCKSSY